MALNYADFKSYVITLLWRDVDVPLANNLDNLIRTANAELASRTSNWQRRNGTIIILPESEDYDLTANVTDFQHIHSLINNTTSANDSTVRTRESEFKKTTLNDIYRRRTANSSAFVAPYYAQDQIGDNFWLRLVGPFSAENPGDLTLNYKVGIPDYATADASWLEDEHLDLYVYTILKHVGIFLREDERIQLYLSMANDAFNIANDADLHHKQFGGTPLQMRPHRPVP